MDLAALWLRLWLKFPPIWSLVAILGLVPSLWMILNASSIEILDWDYATPAAENKQVVSFDLGKQSSYFRPSFDAALQQLEWSSDPIRPDRAVEQKMLTLRLKESKETKKIKPGSKLFIGFDQNSALRLQSESDSFWIEVSDTYFRLGSKSLEGQVIESDMIPISFQETGIRSSGELADFSPFKTLFDAKWLGQDQFLPLFNRMAEVQRIEIGTKDKGEILDLKRNDWLIFDGENWGSCALEQSKNPVAIARWTQKFGQTLEMEGWDGDSYLRFKFDLQPLLPLKKEDLFSQLKIRSEKQISCTIDQQYLILKPGDWVLKADSRWKVLRKKEDRDAFLEGRLSGELFLLERIEIKNGNKKIIGKFFPSTRTQMASIDTKPQESQLKNRRKNMKSNFGQERKVQ